MPIIINLFECFQSVVYAFGIYIEPFALTIFLQCFKIMQRFYTLVLQEDEYLAGGIGYFSISINLLSSLFNALNRQAQVLILQSQQQPAAVTNDFITLLNELLKFKDHNVKQYAFGLLGEIQKNQASECFKL